MKVNYFVREVAIFSCLPPEKSGIANYTEDLILSNRDLTCVASRFTIEEYRKLRLTKQIGRPSDSNQFISLDEFKDRIDNFSNKIFVLGNSSHNLFALTNAIKYGNNKDWVYIHEANLNALWGSFCNQNLLDFNSFRKKFLVEGRNNLGVLPLFVLSKIKKVFVNNKLAKELIEEEIRKSFLKIKVQIEVVFLPLPYIDKKNIIPREKREKLIVGTFGIPSDNYKQTNKIVQAVKLLNEKLGCPSTLFIGGYGSLSYVFDQAGDELFTYRSEPTDYSDFVKLMSCVDISVQLRSNPHGESSGCIQELLALDIPVITTENFVAEVFRNEVYEVSVDVEPIELAEKILLIRNREIKQKLQSKKISSYALSLRMLEKLKD